MLLVASDENYDQKVIAGLLRRCPSLDLVRVVDAGLGGCRDPAILEWCARDGRVLLTHDVSTMTVYAYDRVNAGQRMPGLFVSVEAAPLGPTIDDLVILVECSAPGEWENRVIYLPLTQPLTK